MENTATAAKVGKAVKEQAEEEVAGGSSSSSSRKEGEKKVHEAMVYR